MLLWNQKRHSFSEKLAGKLYSWGPYGSCEVPDELVDDLIAQGMPLKASQVSPQVKTSDALSAEQRAEDEKLATQLQKQLNIAQVREAQALHAAKEASGKEQLARDELAEALARIAVLEKQNAALAAESAEFEKLLTEAARKEQKPAQLPAKQETQTPKK
jgi:hypothetical protein